MNFSRVAIVTLHYKNLADTRECLASLWKLDYPDFKVILVNNDSFEHGEILRQEFADFVQFIQNKGNLGFAEGNNVGIRAALTDALVEAVVILNNDTKVEPNFLSELIKEKADMAAPRVMQFDKRDKIDNLGVTLMSAGLPFNRVSESEKLFCPSGGAALYSRRLLESVSLRAPQKRGEAISSSVASDNEIASSLPLVAPRNDIYYFDPDFFAYCEDLDLGWRARLQGFGVAYAKDAVVYHKGSAAAGKLSNFAVYHTYRNLIWTIFKNCPLPMLILHLPRLALGQILLLLFYTLKLRPYLIIGAWLSALLALPKFIKKRRGIQSAKKVKTKEIASWFAKGIVPRRYL